MLRHTALRAATASPRRVVHSTSRPFPFVNTTRFLTTESIETTQASSPPISSAQKPDASPIVKPLDSLEGRSPSVPARSKPSQPAPRRLTYLVGRTKSNNLCVYDDVKSGGTRKFTIIRRIEGRAEDLKKDLRKDFKFKKDDVNVNPVTGHVAIKGYHAPAVKLWLVARGM